jgi:hypothetical protein
VSEGGNNTEMQQFEHVVYVTMFVQNKQSKKIEVSRNYAKGCNVTPIRFCSPDRGAGSMV